MPRNGSGTYSLPAGNPVVSGTTIQASWANSTLADISTELTGSLARSGAGGMLGALRGVDGTVSVPAFSFTSETTSGFYRAGTGDVRFAMAGADVYTVTTSAVTFALPVVLAAGTASAPSLAATGDLNTGLWFPAADTVAVSTGGSERWRLDASGNLGLGVTPSAWISAYRAIDLGLTGAIYGRTDSSIEVSLAANGYRNSAGNWIYKQTAIAGQFGYDTSGAWVWKTAPTGTAGNAISFTQAMTLDASGNLLVGTTTSSGLVTAEVSGAGSAIGFFQNTAATPTARGLTVSFSNATGTNTSSADVFQVRTAGAERATIRGNGGFANYQANDANLSDERLKTDIQPAASYLDKICAIPVKTFLYKDQTDTEQNLGVIAQDVDAVAPELVDRTGFGDPPEGESPYLAIYQTDLQYALMKCVQELKAQNDELRARVAALEAA